MNHLRILLALLRKESILLRHNPLIPRVIFAMPVMVMLIMPLVANLEVRNVKVAVVDNDHSQLSRRIIADIDHTDALNIVAVDPSYPRALRHIDTGTADVILTIPPRFEARMVTSPEMPLLDIRTNGVNATKATLGAQYVANSATATISSWRIESGVATGITSHSSPVSIVNLFNPTLSFRNYMIPALIVVLLIIICGFLPALNLVNEKETGTIEAINVTPVGRLTFVLSKLIPFWLIALVVVAVGMVIGRLVYGLSPVGSIPAIILAAVLFSLIMSGLGVIIANRSATMLQCIFVMFAIVMVFQLMGGLFTPIDSMPEWAQIITYAIPPRYFIEIMRAIYLKGTTVAQLAPRFLALTLYAAILCVIAASTYSKTSSR